MRGKRHHLVLVAGSQEAEVGSQLLVHQAERVRQRLSAQHLQPPPGVAAGQAGLALSAAVADQDAAPGAGHREPGRGRVRHVVAHETGPVRIQPGQRLREELRGPGRIHGAQVIPGIIQTHLLGRAHQARVIGKADQVDLGGTDPAFREAPAGGGERLLPGGERHRPLAVLAPGEALLLGGRRHRAVDDQRSRRVVKDRIDPQHAHAASPPSRRETGGMTHLAGAGQTCTGAGGDRELAAGNHQGTFSRFVMMF